MKKEVLERRIKSLSGKDVFLRGSQYFRNGYIFNAVIQGQELRAECKGRHGAYRVYADIDDAAIKRATCTCPYSRSEKTCKHAVALLLTWVNNPSEFRRIDPLNKLLQNRSKEDLIELICELVDHKPELLDFVEIASLKADKPYDTEIYRRLVHLAWKQEPWEISLEIDKLRSMPEKFIKNGEWKAAGNILNTILDECVTCYEPEYDEEGDLAISIDEVASGLVRCLSNVQDAVMRKRWLQTMLKAEFKDLELGGVDLAPSAHDALIKQATDEEWEILERQIAEKIHQADGWKEKALQNLLNARQKKARRTRRSC